MGLQIGNFPGGFELSFPSDPVPGDGYASDFYGLVEGFLALKLDESLAKLVGIILAMAVALTGRIVDR